MNTGCRRLFCFATLKFVYSLLFWVWLLINNNFCSKLSFSAALSKPSNSGGGGVRDGGIYPPMTMLS